LCTHPRFTYEALASRGSGDMNEIIAEGLRREGGTLVGFHELAARLVQLRRENSGDAGREDIVKTYSELVRM
jgi:hypothetical protein